MLNIPEEIKNLILTDGTRKNIRITFPYGEHEDITNSNIVMNSVKFTESLCSRDELKFGLSEQSTFECELVDIGNIRGLTIHVYNEIFCDNSIKGAVYKEDLDSYVYPVSYGLFIIASCQKQTDMTHRKLSAFSYDYSLEVNPIEVAKRKTPLKTTNNYKTNYIKMILSNSTIVDSFCTGKIWSAWLDSRDSETHIYYSYVEGRKAYEVIIKLDVCEKLWGGDLEYPDEASMNYDALYELNADDYMERAINGSKKLSNYINEKQAFNLLMPSFSISRYESTGVFQNYTAHNIVKEYNGRFVSLIYPYMSDFFGNRRNHMILKVPKTYYVTIYKLKPDETRDYIVDYFAGNLARDRINLYEIVFDNSLYDSINYEAERSFEDKSAGSGYYCVENPTENINADAFNGLFELRGELVKFSRDGFLESVSIENLFDLYPSQTLYPSQALYPSGANGYSTPARYTSGWYDDELKKPYGRLFIKYKKIDTKTGEEVIVDYYYEFAEDFSEDKYATYNMEHNYCFTNWRFSDKAVNQICASLARKLSRIQYASCDIDGTGQPWLEAGDTVAFETLDGDIVKTIILHRVLTGEQCLIDSLESK